MIYLHDGGGWVNSIIGRGSLVFFLRWKGCGFFDTDGNGYEEGM